MKDPLIIFDTTMRDGEQSPGASMTKEEKLRIARQLERMRVDVVDHPHRHAESRGEPAGDIGADPADERVGRRHDRSP